MCDVFFPLWRNKREKKKMSFAMANILSNNGQRPAFFFPQKKWEDSKNLNPVACERVMCKIWNYYRGPRAHLNSYLFMQTQFESKILNVFFPLKFFLHQMSMFTSCLHSCCILIKPRELEEFCLFKAGPLRSVCKTFSLHRSTKMKQNALLLLACFSLAHFNFQLLLS